MPVDRLSAEGRAEDSSDSYARPARVRMFAFVPPTVESELTGYPLFPFLAPTPSLPRTSENDVLAKPASASPSIGSMTENVRFFEEAAAEIEHEREWYRMRSHAAETAFLCELDHAIEVVEEAPHRWSQYLAGTRRYVFPRFPFSLVYFVENDIVVVVALASEARRPGYWRKRLHE